jgi:hypothetical protein
MFSSHPTYIEMIGMLKEKPTARIVRKVITRRYPHREETYTYERYYLEVPAEYYWIRPFFNQKNYNIDVKEKGNGLEIISSLRKKAPAKKDRQQKT